MWQTIFHIQPDWLLPLWAVVSVVVLLSAARRENAWQEIVGYVPLLAAFGAVIYFVLPNLTQPGLGLPIRGFGMMLLLGVLAGVGLALYRAWQMGVDSEIIYSLAFWMFVFGIFGARLFYVIEYRQDFIRPTVGQSLLAMLNVPEGGIVVYGAIFGGIAAALVFFRVRQLPALALADVVVPGMVLGGSLGRIGCLLNGCCFGGLAPETFPAVTFPPSTMPYARHAELGYFHGFALREQDGRAVISRVVPGGAADKAGLLPGETIVAMNSTAISGEHALEEARHKLQLGQPELTLRLGDGRTKILAFQTPARCLPVHPAQVYDAINLALITLVLWFYYPLRRRDGELLALLCTLYPLSRFVMEVIRVDEPSQLGTGFSISQLISIGLLFGAIPIWLFVESRPASLALPWQPALFKFPSPR